MSLSHLPVELIETIGSYLQLRDVLSIVRCSKWLQYCISGRLLAFARHHRKLWSGSLVKDLHHVTFWFDREKDESVIEWAIAHRKQHVVNRIMEDPRLDLRESDIYGVTLLHKLAAQGLIDFIPIVVEGLKARGQEPFHTDRSHLTALHYAAGRGMVGAVIMLIALGADTSAQDHHGNTPLHLAAMTGSCQVFVPLIQGGADVNARGRFGWTPVDQASISHHVAAVEELMRLGSQSPSWHSRENAIAEFLLSSPCPIECFVGHMVV